MNGDSVIVEEVRRRAMEISARYDHDLRKYAEHLYRVQEEYSERLVSQITVVPARPTPPKAEQSG